MGSHQCLVWHPAICLEDEEDEGCGCYGIVVLSLFMLCSGGAGEICTHIFPSCLIQPEHLGDVRGGTIPWVCPLGAPGQGGRDGRGCPPIRSHAVTRPQSRDETFPCHRSFLQTGWGAAKNQKSISSPGEFQHFEMWFGANLTGKPK